MFSGDRCGGGDVRAGVTAGGHPVEISWMGERRGNGVTGRVYSERTTLAGTAGRHHVGRGSEWRPGEQWSAIRTWGVCDPDRGRRRVEWVDEEGHVERGRPFSSSMEREGLDKTLQL